MADKTEALPTTLEDAIRQLKQARYMERFAHRHAYKAEAGEALAEAKASNRAAEIDRLNAHWLAHTAECHAEVEPVDLAQRITELEVEVARLAAELADATYEEFTTDGPEETIMRPRGGWEEVPRG